MNDLTREKRGPGRPKNEARGNDNKQRPPRVPLGQGQKLVAAHREGYQRYWALDLDGQLEQMQAAWWDFVLDENGQKITKPAGKGNTHYLMEIEKQYYDDDMTKQQDMVTDALRKTTERGSDEYVPMGKEDVLTRDKI